MSPHLVMMYLAMITLEYKLMKSQVQLNANLQHLLCGLFK